MHVGLSNSKGRKSAIQPWYMYIYIRNFPHFSIGPSATFVAWKFQGCQEVKGITWLSVLWLRFLEGSLCTILRGWNEKLALGYEIPWMRSIPFTPPGRHTPLSVGVGLGWYCMLPYWIAFCRASRGTVDEDMECAKPYNMDLSSLWHLSSWQHVIHHQEMLRSHSVLCAHIELSLYYLQLFLTPLLLNRPGLLKPHGHLLRF